MNLVHTAAAPFRSMGSALGCVGKYTQTNIYMGMGATAVAWYGYQLSLLYLPGIMTQYVIADVVRRVGNQFFGELIGGYLVAPTTIPALVPHLANVVHFAIFWGIVVAINLIYYTTISLRGQGKEAISKEQAPTSTV